MNNCFHINEIAFTVTKYNGYEEEILSILNRSRDKSRTRKYLDWRYARECENFDPLVFWVKHKNSIIGMAALIPRRYYYEDKQDIVYILGDIALIDDYREKGLGTRLFLFMNNFIEENLEKQILVIPNEAAKRTLLKCGWSEPVKFVWYLWILDPVYKMKVLQKHSALSNKFKLVMDKVQIMWLKRYVSGSKRLVNCDCFDNDFENFWDRFQKRGLIIKDRSTFILKKRFAHHPEKTFNIKKFEDNDQMYGYIICRSDKDGVCRVFDLISLDNRGLREMIAMFILDKIKEAKDITIRIKLHSNQSQYKIFKSIGFFARKEEDIFQEYYPLSRSSWNPLKWYLTAADKDV